MVGWLAGPEGDSVPWFIQLALQSGWPQLLTFQAVLAPHSFCLSAEHLHSGRVQLPLPVDPSC